MSRFLPALPAVPLLLLSLPAAAIEPMVGAELAWVRVDVAGQTFNPFAARGKLALALTPAWEIGVTGGGGIAEDEEVALTTEVGSFASGYVRFGSSLGDSARLSLMVGYGEIDLDIATAMPGFPASAGYSGMLWGISLEERLKRFPAVTGSLDWERWYDDQGLVIDMVSYGFRYGF